MVILSEPSIAALTATTFSSKGIATGSFIRISTDHVSSVFYDWFKYNKLVKPERYKVEGIGDEFLIKTAQLEYLDDMIKVEDKKAFSWAIK